MPTTSREEAIFASALEKTTRAERAAYLEGACGDDAELRVRIEALLAAHGKNGGVLDAPPSEITLSAPGQPLTEGPGTIIGPYKLLQQIGEGGMGVVYMAEQIEPVRRTVALKIIKPGMDSRQVIARFEAERQALALMDHPHIAKVLDAGSTDTGRPYFVMELVKGMPITKYCDAQKLPLAKRLELFVQVCQAMQHAHQKGIIHRDIKPSNVLIAPYDGKPVVKVIDFGVAKAMGQRLTERTMFTEFGAMIGTLEYMSPEQAELNNQDIDTRSDIYALGVLLYELLTGTTPLDMKKLRGAAVAALLMQIQEEEPPRPSLRLSSSAESLPVISEQRQSDPAKLPTLVRGELDWIVMKCLEKDRSRRYETASGLARDVERHLADETVEACPPSTRYRLSKFARKYKKSLITAAAFAVLLVAGAATSTMLAIWARSAERDAVRHRVASDAAKTEAEDAKSEAVRQRDQAHLTAYAAGMRWAQRAWNEGDVVHVRELLDDVPKAAAGRNLQGFEWYYLSRLSHSEERSISGHAGPVQSVAFSPDGLRVASACDDQMVKIWDVASGKEVLCFKGHFGPVLGVAFSPDGQRLASASADNTAKVWDAATGKELFPLKGHSARVTSVTFSPDGRRIATASDDQSVRLWDSATGKEIKSFKDHYDRVYCVAFSPDGQRLASGSEDHVAIIWDIATGKELLTIDRHTEGVMSVAFSPDGKRLATGSADNLVKVWDCATGELLLSLGDASNWITCVTFSPDGLRLAAASHDWSVKVWDTTTGKLLSLLKGHAEGVLSVAFSPDGQRLASGSADRTVIIWNSAAGKELFTLEGTAEEATSVAFSPDGQRLASGSRDKTVRLWDIANGREQLILKGHGDAVTSVAFSPDGQQLASGSDDKTVKIWDGATGKELFTLKGHTEAVLCVAFSPDGQRLASASSDKTVKVWEIATRTELCTFKGHTGRINCVAFTKDGQRLASASDDQTVKVWDVSARKEIFSVKSPASAAASVVFSPDGQFLVSGGSDKLVRIWDSMTGKERSVLKGHRGPVTSVAFTPDGRRIVTAGWSVKVWDSESGKELQSLEGRADVVTSVAVSTNGESIASANRTGVVNLWETHVAAEAREGRAINQLVDAAFRQLGLRTDVLDWLHTGPGISPNQQREALVLAQAHPESALSLAQLAWQKAKVPGRPISDYRTGQKYIEEACRLDPNSYQSTLGMVCYRIGDDLRAILVFQHAEQIRQQRKEGELPANIAFVAMTLHRVGHTKLAQVELQRLRQLMKDPYWGQDTDSVGLLREAEAALAAPKSSGDK